MTEHQESGRFTSARSARKDGGLKAADRSRRSFKTLRPDGQASVASRSCHGTIPAARSSRLRITRNGLSVYGVLNRFRDFGLSTVAIRYSLQRSLAPRNGLPDTATCPYHPPHQLHRRFCGDQPHPLLCHVLGDRPHTAIIPFAHVIPAFWVYGSSAEYNRASAEQQIPIRAVLVGHA